MKDLEILSQLLKGNHLNEKELQRAFELARILRSETENRAVNNIWNKEEESED